MEIPQQANRRSDARILVCPRCGESDACRCGEPAPGAPDWKAQVQEKLQAYRERREKLDAGVAEESESRVIPFRRRRPARTMEWTLEPPPAPPAPRRAIATEPVAEPVDAFRHWRDERLTPPPQALAQQDVRQAVLAAPNASEIPSAEPALASQTPDSGSAQRAEIAEINALAEQVLASWGADEFEALPEQDVTPLSPASRPTEAPDAIRGPLAATRQLLDDRSVSERELQEPAVTVGINAAVDVLAISEPAPGAAAGCFDEIQRAPSAGIAEAVDVEQDTATGPWSPVADAWEDEEAALDASPAPQASRFTLASTLFESELTDTGLAEPVSRPRPRQTLHAPVDLELESAPIEISLAPIAEHDGAPAPELARPAASCQRRWQAGLTDAYHVAIGAALFAFTAWARLGFAAPDRHSLKHLLALVAVFPLLGCLYVLLSFVLAGATPGMLSQGLQVLTFDGRRASRGEMLKRAVATALTLVSGGLGYAWSICDPQQLTWHDYLSQTYVVEREG